MYNEKTKYALIIAALVMMVAAFFLIVLYVDKRSGPQTLTMPNIGANAPNMAGRIDPGKDVAGWVGPSSVTDEAQAEIDNEPHKERVKQAKKYLKEKASLEKRLETVNKALSDIDLGRDVPDDSNVISITSPGKSWYRVD